MNYRKGLDDMTNVADVKDLQVGMWIADADKNGGRVGKVAEITDKGYVRMLVLGRWVDRDYCVYFGAGELSFPLKRVRLATPEEIENVQAHT